MIACKHKMFGVSQNRSAGEPNKDQSSLSWLCFCSPVGWVLLSKTALDQMARCKWPVVSLVICVAKVITKCEEQGGTLHLLSPPSLFTDLVIKHGLTWASCVQGYETEFSGFAMKPSMCIKEHQRMHFDLTCVRHTAQMLSFLWQLQMLAAGCFDCCIARAARQLQVQASYKRALSMPITYWTMILTPDKRWDNFKCFRVLPKLKACKLLNGSNFTTLWQYGLYSSARAFGGCVLCPLGNLVVFHCYLIATNTTTNEELQTFRDVLVRPCYWGPSVEKLLWRHVFCLSHSTESRL